MALTDKLTAIANAIRTQSGKTDKLTLAQMPNEIINLQSLNFEVVGGVGAVAENAGTVLGTISGRTYTKVTGGKAVWAFVYNGQYTGPMIVSLDRDACSYSTSGDYIDTIIAMDTVTYNGKTYYYSAGS
jgi:hypothetical protein